MVDDRTQEQIYADWVDTVNKCHKKGWVCNGGWNFISPSGTLHDLSAADLKQLDRIEKEGLFLTSIVF